jgi:O-antigen ligase/Flp pilus assembly protein TadD
MRNKLLFLFESLIVVLLYAGAGLTPLLVVNQTTDIFEIPKLVFLIVLTVVLYLLWAITWVLRGKVRITRTPLNIPMLLLLLVVVLSTVVTTTKFPAIFGNFPRVHGSAVAWITYILLYFVTVSNLSKGAYIKGLVYVLYLSGVVVAAISLLSFFGVYLPFDFAQAANFTPTGSTFSTISLVLLLVPLPLVSLIAPNRYLPTALALPLAIFFSAAVIILGTLPLYAILLVAYILCFFTPKHHNFKKTVPIFLIPVLTTAIVLLTMYLPIPGLAFPQRVADLPKEIQLPLDVSWKISATALRDAPIVGTGPSSYLFNFTEYKPVEFNQLPYWNLMFDTAYNEYLQIIGTLGILGIVTFMLLCVVLVVHAWKKIITAGVTAEHDSLHTIVPGLAISGILSVLVFAVHASTLVSVVSTFMLFAVLMASQKSIRERVTNVSVGTRAAGKKVSFDLLPVILFIVILVGGSVVLFETANTVLADYWHKQALSYASTNGSRTYEYLQKSESLNPYIDLYRVDMAQTNLALANALVVQRGPTQSAPDRALNNRDKATVQTLITQAINEGKVAASLSPRSSRNWSLLATSYQNVAGVAKNAVTFSLDAYGRAIQRDPFNPVLRMNVGGIYYAAKNYNMAVRFFTDAINLKSDYANAYYNLAISLRESNDLQTSLAVAEQTVALLTKQNKTNTDDYKTAVALVDELKSKVAAAAIAPKTVVKPTLSAGRQAPTPTPSTTPSLQLNTLENPPSVTPPAAVGQ